MKKLLIITFLITLSCSVFSQEVICDTLYGIRSDVTHLTVAGKIDVRNFMFIKCFYPNLTHLDLSQAQIVSYEDYYKRYLSNSNKDNEIPSFIFQYNKKLKRIILPESLISIGYMAFDNTNIDSIVIPAGVKYIRNYAFKNCSNLSYIKIHENAKFLIFSEAFKNCTSLEEIVNSHNIMIIESKAFENCHSLRSFTLYDNISKIDDNIFKNCKSLQSIIIPESVKSIGACAFSGCSELTTINIPKHLSEIKYTSLYARFTTIADSCKKLTSFSVAKGNPAFSDINGILYNKDKTILIRCPEGIKGEVVIPASVVEIAQSAFENSNIQRVKFGKNVQIIGKNAFRNCTSLTAVEFSKKLKCIDDRAFLDCKILGDIDIPESVNWIGSDVFKNCECLGKISVYWQEPQSVYFNHFTSNDNYKGLEKEGKRRYLIIPFGTENKYYQRGWYFELMERPQEKNNRK